MKKLKQCANNRYCRVRSFVQLAAIVLVAAIVVIYLWDKGVISA
ncbi:MAG: hypothetical protein ACE5FQ_06200 [Thiogranum sp.]